MRIGVFSDTHGFCDYVKIAIPRMGNLDLILHAGDYYTDKESLEKMTAVQVEAVVGNCDPWANGPREQIFKLEGKKLLLTHGHRYGIKNNLQKLFYRAEEVGADVVVFGHTHYAESVMYGGILLFNPGSISRPRGQAYPSYGILEITAEAVTPHIHYIENDF
ncbi:YfcE family phosphodiesterase [Desulfolucanica intricata]|uniref:YfcE family phosphodiesterase n=1 Tax=Desulfolucanica intricata TaxID=1285191 RepID=UPI00083691FB|nr:metallophosphoesterase [Desulfolucanica intricata]